MIIYSSSDWPIQGSEGPNSETTFRINYVMHDNIKYFTKKIDNSKQAIISFPASTGIRFRWPRHSYVYCLLHNPYNFSWDLCHCFVTNRMRLSESTNQLPGFWKSHAFSNKTNPTKSCCASIHLFSQHGLNGLEFRPHQ